MKTRILLFLFTLLFVFSVGTVYAGQFGPAELTAKEKGFAVSVGYFHYAAKFISSNSAKWNDADIISDMVYAKVAYAMSKRAEMYLKLGGANAKINDAFVTSIPGITMSGFKSDFQDGFKPFASLGAKAVFNPTASITLAPFIEASIISGFNDKSSGVAFGVPLTQEANISAIKEINLGVTAQVKAGKVAIYGGPMFYLAKTDLKSKVSAAGITQTMSAGYSENGSVGAFAGVKIPIGKNYSLGIEAQQKSKFSAGMEVSYSF